MTEFKANTYDDGDMRDVIAEYEGLNDEAEEVMASARGKVSGIRKKQKALKKRAKDDLSIPSAILGPILKQRALERQLQRLSDDIDTEWSEMWVDAAGQFSLFKPEDGEDEPEDEPVAKRAAKRRAKQAKADSEAEQAAGAEVLDGLTGTVN